MDRNLIVLLIPLIVLELILKIVCLRDWIHREHFNKLSKQVWLILFLFLNLFGPIAYLVYGRKTDGRY